LGIKKHPLLPHFYFVLSAWARAVVIDQGTKSKRIGAKSAEDFAEKNLGDLLPRTHRTHKNSALFSARSASPRFAETIRKNH
jgi:hypothetical protein